MNTMNSSGRANRLRRRSTRPTGDTQQIRSTRPTGDTQQIRSTRPTGDTQQIRSPHTDTYVDSDFKTPTRVTKSRYGGGFNADSRYGGGGVFSGESPFSDNELQHDIVWDANSPSPVKTRGRKQPVSCRTVDISAIVKRIAPKHGRPAVSDPVLQQWIGENAAIPSTPSPDLHPPRKKKSPRTDGVEALMELAKQFDLNMFRHRETSSSSSTATSLSAQDGTAATQNPTPVLCKTEPLLPQGDVDSATSELQSSSPKLFDDLDELDAIFDGPTQHVSGALSQLTSEPNPRIALTNTEGSRIKDCSGNIRETFGNNTEPSDKIKDSFGNIKYCSGNNKDSSGNIKGHSGNIKGPSGNINGPSGNINGPSGNIKGPSGNMNNLSRNIRETFVDITKPSGSIKENQSSAVPGTLATPSPILDNMSDDDWGDDDFLDDPVVLALMTQDLQDVVPPPPPPPKHCSTQKPPAGEPGPGAGGGTRKSFRLESNPSTSYSQILSDVSNHLDKPHPSNPGMQRSAPSNPRTQCSAPSNPKTQCSAPSNPSTQYSVPSNSNTQCSAPSNPRMQCSAPSNPRTQCSAPSNHRTQYSAPSNPRTQCSAPSNMKMQCSVLSNNRIEPTVSSNPRTGPTVSSNPRTGPTVSSNPRTGPTVPSNPRTGPTVPSNPRTGSTVSSNPRTGPTVPSNLRTGPTVPSIHSTGPTVPSKPRIEPSSVLSSSRTVSRESVPSRDTVAAPPHCSTGGAVQDVLDDEDLDALFSSSPPWDDGNQGNNNEDNDDDDLLLELCEVMDRQISSSHHGHAPPAPANRQPALCGPPRETATAGGGASSAPRATVETWQPHTAVHNTAARFTFKRPPPHSATPTSATPTSANTVGGRSLTSTDPPGGGRCSAEQIELKKRQAMERRRLRMMNLH